MKLLVVTSMYPPHHLGGYELSCRDTVRRWVAAGHDLSVLASTYRRPDVDEPDDPAVPVARDLEWYWKDGRFLTPDLRTRLGIERRNRRRLLRTLAKRRPDVVSVWQMGGMSLALLTTLAGSGVPAVYVVADEWLGYGPQVDPWLTGWRQRPWLAAVVRRLTRIPTRLPDLTGAAMCFTSDWLRRRAEIAIGGRIEASSVVAPGIDTADFPLLPAVAGRPWRGRLLCVGRVEPRKGFATAIEALAHLPGTTLRIVGPVEDEGYRRELQQRVEQLGVVDRVQWTSVPRDRLAAEYAAADVLLFTSVWDEPFGLVPLEAMACGTAVVATGTGGSAEFLTHDVNCLLYPPEDAPAIAAAVTRLAADPTLRDRLREAGRSTAAAHSADDYAGALETIHVAAAT